MFVLHNSSFTDNNKLILNKQFLKRKLIINATLPFLWPSLIKSAFNSVGNYKYVIVCLVIYMYILQSWVHEFNLTRYTWAKIKTFQLYDVCCHRTAVVFSYLSGWLAVRYIMRSDWMANRFAEDLRTYPNWLFCL